MPKKRIKTCVITGATGGIGTALSKNLLKNYNLILISKNINKLNRLKKKLILKANNKIEIYQCDFSNINNLKSLSKKFSKKDVDILINNAAIFDINNFEKESDIRTIDSININLISHMLLTKTVLKNMKKNKSGKIVFIGSTSSYKGVKNTVTYCAAKHGLLGFSKSINDEFNKFNIQSFIISPGTVKTKMSRKIQNQNYTTFIEPDEFAEYVNFILIENKSSFINEILVRRKYV